MSRDEPHDAVPATVHYAAPDAVLETASGTVPGAVRGTVYDAAERNAAGRPGARRITVDNAAELFLASVLTGHVDTVSTLAFSPAGGLIATGSRDGTVLIRDSHSGAVRHTLAQDGGSVSVAALAFSPDGSLLAVAGTRGDWTWEAGIWDAVSGESVRSVAGHSEPLTGVAFSPLGELLATCSEDRTIRLWDVRTGAASAVLLGHAEAVNAVAFSPDGTLLASAAADRTCGIWDVRTGRCRTKLSCLEKARAVAFSPDGARLAAAAGDGVLLWDLGFGDRRLPRVRVAEDRSWIWDVAFSPDGTLLAAAAIDRSIRIIDVAGGRPAGLIRDQPCETVAFSPDGTMLAAVGTDHTVRMWGPTGVDEVAMHAQDGMTRRPGRVVREGVGLATVAFDAGVTRVVTADFEGSASLWRIGAQGEGGERGRRGRRGGGREVKLVRGRPVTTAMALSPDGALLAIGTRPGTIEFWDARTGWLRRIFDGHVSRIDGLAFSPDGALLAAASHDGTATVWDMEWHRCFATFREHRNLVVAVSFSADGSLLATASADATARIWRLETGECQAVLRGHISSLRAVEFSPTSNSNSNSYSNSNSDSHLVATAANDSTARLWTAEGDHVATLTGHWSPIGALAFSPDARLVATGSDDKTIRIWDVETARPVVLLAGHTAQIRGLAFTGDGRRVVSAAADRTIREWDL